MGGLQMRQNKKKAVAVVLILALVLSMATGCAKKGAGQTDAAKNTEKTGVASKEASTSEASDASSNEIISTFTGIDGDPIEVKSGVKFPLENPVTLTFWYDPGWNFIGEMETLGEGDVWKWMEEQTNVHIDFIHPASGTGEQSYQLLFASDKMPDILYATPTYEYTYGAQAAVDDGYYCDLTDYVAKYAPNYTKILDTYPVINSNVKTDDGKILSFNQMYMPEHSKACNAGPSIRADLLEKVGMKVEDLVTYDDWHEALTKLKDAGLCEVPLYISKTGSMEYDEFLAGYGTAQDFIVIDGNVKYGPIEDGYGEYIDMLKQWYKEGLIDSDFGLNARDPEEVDVINNKYAAWWSYCSWNGTKKWNASMGVADGFNLIGTRLPVKEAGQIAHYRTPDLINNEYGFHITADCENVDVAVAWFDLWYDANVALVANYGIGDTHVKNADGTYDWSEKITKADDASAARGRYVLPVCPFENYTRISNAWSDAQKESQKNWLDSSDYAYFYPNFVVMTAEENTEYSTIMADITTFVEEETYKMVAGNSSYTFDTFRDHILKMGIEDAVKIKQAAYERYINR
jgi:putative aldouronate transport system substrate-binding protein